MKRTMAIACLCTLLAVIPLVTAAIAKDSEESQRLEMEKGAADRRADEEDGVDEEKAVKRDEGEEGEEGTDAGDDREESTAERDVDEKRAEKRDAQSEDEQASGAKARTVAGTQAAAYDKIIYLPTRKYVKVKASKVNVYREATTGSTVVGTATKSTTYRLLEEKSGWFKIQFSDKVTGWMQTNSGANAFKVPFIRVALSAGSKTSKTFQPSQTSYALLEDGSSKKYYTLQGGTTYKVNYESKKLVLYEGTRKLVTSTNANASLRVSPAGYGGTFTIGKYKYLGHLHFKYYDPSLQVVNEVDMEDYLKGVVPFEMSDSFHLEALKSQAVAARTYATRHRNSYGGKAKDYITDTVLYQVYRGYDAAYTQSIKAVEQTATEVLVYGGAVIDAVYHASNGGYTEDAANVWTGSIPYFQSYPDPYDKRAGQYHNWTYKANAKELAALVAKNNDTPLDRIAKLSITKKAASGRVVEMRINGYEKQKSKTVTLLKERTRTAFNLRSQLYSVTRSNPKVSVVDSSGKAKSLSLTDQTVIAADAGSTSKYTGAATLSDGTKKVDRLATFTFTGSGFGHGIGMSQWGAKQMGDEGKTYRDILSFYYRGTKVVKQYNE